jgi:hypothetical protein
VSWQQTDTATRQALDEREAEVDHEANNNSPEDDVDHLRDDRDAKLARDPRKKKPQDHDDRANDHQPDKELFNPWD